MTILKKFASGLTSKKTLADAKNPDKVQPYNGFTLIELLVTISIMGILMAIVIVGYVEFNRRQILLQATRQIVQDLRLAQSLASNNQKPDADSCSSGCSILDGYIFLRDGGTYTIFANCYSGDFTTGCDPPIKSVTLASDFSFSGFTMARFRVLRQGVMLTGGSTLTISAFEKSQTIVVDKGGSIRIQGETP